jgi:hypothetical protein
MNEDGRPGRAGFGEHHEEVPQPYLTALGPATTPDLSISLPNRKEENTMDSRDVPKEHARLSARLKPGQHVRIIRQDRGGLATANELAQRHVRLHTGKETRVLSTLLDNLGNMPCYVVYLAEV